MAERETFKDRLEEIRERIERAARAAGRNSVEIRLIAATKTVSVERLREAVVCGCRIFGENRVQEALAKMEILSGTSGTEWHFLGALQSNKVKSVIGRFRLLHALDRMERLGSRLIDHIRLDQERGEVEVENVTPQEELEARRGLDVQRLLEDLAGRHGVEGFDLG